MESPISARLILGLLTISAVAGLGLLLQSGSPWGAALVVAGYAGTGAIHLRLARRARRERDAQEAALASQAASASSELAAQRQQHVDQERVLAQQKLDLEAKNRELSALSEAKTRFLASTSHELRTPLNAIIGFAELLIDGVAGPVAEGQAQYLTDIRSSGAHLLRLINDILDYSKLEAGKLQLVEERVELAELVREGSQMLSASAQRKRIAVELSLEAGVVVLGDPLRLKQVVVNLVANAVKFTPPDGRVDVGLRSQEDRAVLMVTDTGIGIAPEYQQAIFEPFTQVENEESRRFEGTGLGLSLVKSLVESMNGTIQVKSTPGRGATFVVDFPRQLSRLLVPTGAAARALDVLVAEDDDATRYLLCRLLAANGCTTRGAANGQRALEALAEQLPDVLVLDLMMPELDGYGVLERMRSLPLGGNVKVVVYSAAEPSDENRTTLERAGAQILIKGTVPTQAVIAAVKALARTAVAGGEGAGRSAA